MYQNIADSELSAGDAASYIISQMKAFNISAEDSMQIIDKTNEVKLLLTSINCVNFWKAKMEFFIMLIKSQVCVEIHKKV
jgi:hypothetical protein